MALALQVNSDARFASDYESFVLELIKVAQHSSCPERDQCSLLSRFLGLDWDKSKQDTYMSCIACGGKNKEPSLRLPNEMSLHENCFLIMSSKWISHCYDNPDGFDNMGQSLMYGTDLLHPTDNNWYKMAKKYLFKELLFFYDLGKKPQEEEKVGIVWPNRLNAKESRIWPQLDEKSNELACLMSNELMSKRIAPESIVQFYIEDQDQARYQHEHDRLWYVEDTGYPILEGDIFWWDYSLREPDHIFRMQLDKQIKDMFS